MRAPLDTLARFCRQNDLPFTERTEERFAEYLDLLVEFNQSMNLIGPLDEAEIVDQLLVDSAAAAAVSPPKGSMLDVGTGAGLPGIPLKILYPDLALTLVEPRRKRTTFLRIATTRLDLDAVSIERARIENLAEATFEYVISKAFQPPLEWLETASRWRSPEGVIVCLTRPAERAALEARAADLGLEVQAACDDTTSLGAAGFEEARAVYLFG